MSTRRSVRFMVPLLTVLLASGKPGLTTAQTAPNDPVAASPQAMPGMQMDMTSASPASTPQASSQPLAPASMADMGMQDTIAQGMVLLDQLDMFHDGAGIDAAWEAEGWYGSDLDKLWLRSEGDDTAGRVQDADLETLWSHAVSAFWNTQLGIRQDVATGEHRTWAAFGLQGIAPYWLDVQATAYLDTTGHAAARFRAEHDWRFTQRCILQAEIETNLYQDAATRTARTRDVSDMQVGLRLRYDVTRQVSPYIGVFRQRNFETVNDTVGPMRDINLGTRVMLGLHAWF